MTLYIHLFILILLSHNVFLIWLDVLFTILNGIIQTSEHFNLVTTVNLHPVTTKLQAVGRAGHLEIHRRTKPSCSLGETLRSQQVFEEISCAYPCPGEPEMINFAHIHSSTLVSPSLFEVCTLFNVKCVIVSLSLFKVSMGLTPIELKSIRVKIVI